MATWAKTDTPGKFRVRASVGSGADRRRPTKIIYGNTRNIDRLAAEWEASLDVDPAPAAESEPADDDPASGPTFTACFRAYIDATAEAKGWSDAHRRDRERALDDIDETPLGAMPMATVTRADIGAHLTAYASRTKPNGEPYSAATVRARKVVLVAVVGYAIADPDIEVRGNPTAGVDTSQAGTTVAERDIPTIVEFGRLIERATDAMELAVVAELEGRGVRGRGYRGRPGYRHRAEMLRDVAGFALGSGMRRAEVCALRAHDVSDLPDGSASVLVRHAVEAVKGGGWRLVSTKTKKPRRITVPPPVADILRRRIGATAALAKADEVTPRARGFVFSTGWGDDPLMPDAVSKWWDRLRDFEPALDGLRLQDLRHSHCAHLHSLGLHPRAIAEHMGHSKEVSTTTYDHVRPGADAMLADAIGAAWVS